MNEEKQELIEEALEKLEKAGFDDYAIAAVKESTEFIRLSIGDNTSRFRMHSLYSVVRELGLDLNEIKIESRNENYPNLDEHKAVEEEGDQE